VACGREHTVCVAAGGALYAWGWGEAGRLGSGESGKQLAPQRMDSMRSEPARAVACGREHTLIATKSGALFVCGAGYGGRLGLGDNRDAPFPVRVQLPALPAPAEEGEGAGAGAGAGAGGGTAGAAEGGGAARGSPPLPPPGGVGGPSPPPPRAAAHWAGSDWVESVAGGEVHSACVTRSGHVFSWGFGGSGALGHGDTRDHKVTRVQ
jgi:alpha-tubulin suppressor-like RCC1 family protein